MERPLDPPEEDEIKEADYQEAYDKALADIIEDEISSFGEYLQDVLLSDDEVKYSIQILTQAECVEAMADLPEYEWFPRAMYVNEFGRSLRRALAKVQDFQKLADKTARQLV